MEMATLQRQRSTPQMKTIIEQNTKLKRSMDWHDCLCCHWTPSHSSTFARCHPPRKPNQETWHFWQLVSQGNPYWEQPSNVMIRISMAPVSATVQKCNLHLFRRVALIRVSERVPVFPITNYINKQLMAQAQSTQAHNYVFIKPHKSQLYDSWEASFQSFSIWWPADILKWKGHSVDSVLMKYLLQLTNQ